MRTLLFVMSLAIFGLPLSREVAPDYDPQWAPGDTWMVQYKVRAIRRPKQPGPPPADVRVPVTYTYTVSAVTADKVVIDAAPDGPGRRWLLTFDRVHTVLQTVDQVLDGGEMFRHVNPFVDDAWMAELPQYHSTIIHDFPKLPDSETNETRLLQPAVTGTPGFTQSVTFAADSATIILSRTDPTSARLHRSTIVWKKGAKWWSSAVIRLGGDVQVSGLLLPG